MHRQAELCAGSILCTGSLHRRTLTTLLFHRQVFLQAVLRIDLLLSFIHAACSLASQKTEGRDRPGAGREGRQVMWGELGSPPRVLLLHRRVLLLFPESFTW